MLAPNSSALFRRVFKKQSILFDTLVRNVVLDGYTLFCTLILRQREGRTRNQHVCTDSTF